MTPEERRHQELLACAVIIVEAIGLLGEIIRTKGRGSGGSMQFAALLRRMPKP